VPVAPGEAWRRVPAEIPSSPGTMSRTEGLEERTVAAKAVSKRLYPEGARSRQEPSGERAHLPSETPTSPCKALRELRGGKGKGRATPEGESGGRCA
jgi:hypothetical protein